MLDIGIGIWLMWRNGKEAAARGRSKGQWMAITAGLWWGGEVLGIIIAVIASARGRTDLMMLLLISYPLMITGGVISWQLVNRLGVPAWMAPAPGFMPTHSVPAGGLPVTDAPDPTRPVVGLIPQFEPLMVIAVAGDWVQVRASNGWIGWADGRILNGRAWAQLGSPG